LLRKRTSFKSFRAFNTGIHTVPQQD